RLVVLALCAVGLVGFCVWGQHMFSSGLNPFSPLVFSVLAASLGLPSAILVVSWFATLWTATIHLNTSLLLALGLFRLFLSALLLVSAGTCVSFLAAWVGRARSFIPAGIVIPVFAQVIFLINFLWSLLRGERVKEDNPWCATTLEWSVGSPAPADNFGEREP